MNAPTARISSAQLICLGITFNEVALLLVLPGPLADLAGPDAWIALIAGILGGAMPVALLLHGAAQYHPGKDTCQMAEAALGKWCGKAVSLFIMLLALSVASLVIRDVMDFTIVAILPGTPLWIVGLFFTLIATYTAWCGGEVLVRLGVLVIMLKTLTILTVPLTLWGDLSLIRILPILGDGIGPVLKGAWPTFGWFGQSLILGQFLGMLDQRRLVFRSLALGALYAGLFLEIFLLATLMIFGHKLTSLFVYPTYALAQEVSIGEFMERLELALVVIWLGGMVVMATACLWGTSTAAVRILGIKSDRWVLLPLAAAAFGLTFIWPSLLSLTVFSTRLWTPFVYPLQLAVPALLLVSSWWQARRKQGAEA